jgi:hypothetical protein
MWRLQAFTLAPVREGRFSMYIEAPGFRPGPRIMDDVAGNLCTALVSVREMRFHRGGGQWQGLTLVHFSAQPQPFWPVSRLVSSL